MVVSEWPFPLVLGEVATTLLVVGALLSAAGSLIAARKKGPQSKLPDDALTTLTSRGARVPMVIGRYRSGGVLAWVGGNNPVAGDEVGGKNVGRTQRETVYDQDGWCLLDVMPVQHYYETYDGARRIWHGDLTPANTPHGTLVGTDDNDGEFYVGWGGLNPQEYVFLRENLRTSALHPYVMYVYWKPKRNASGVYGQLEYVRETGCPAATLEGSAYWLFDGHSRGVNPAHVVFQLLTAPYPHGAGVDPGLIDKTSLEAFGVLCEAEHLPCNLLIEGESVKQVLGRIASDMGILFVQNGRRLCVVAVRKAEGAVPALSEHEVDTTTPEVEVLDRSRRSRPVRYVFKDPNVNYRNNDVGIFNDGVADVSESPEEQERELTTVTSRRVARKIASRDSRQLLSDPESIKVTVQREAVDLMPGDVFDHPNGQRMRVVSARRLEDGVRGQLTCVSDVYSGAAGGGTLDGEYEYEGPLEVAQDLAVWAGVTEAGTLAVLRIRAHQQVSGANVYLSVDGGSSYSRVGTQDAAASGGALLTGIGLDAVWQGGETVTTEDYRRPTVGTGLRYRAVTAGVTGGSEPVWPEEIGVTVDDGEVVWAPTALEDGPEFEPLNDDAGWDDYDGDPASWKLGRQVGVIGEEVFFVRSVEVQSEADWVGETGYAAGEAVVPVGYVTGLRYVAVGGGTSGVEEPAWPREAGETVVDGGLTWVGKRFRQRLRGLIGAREGTEHAAHGEGATVYLIAAASLTALTDPAIAAGGQLTIKTQPITASQTAPLSLAAAVEVVRP